MRLILRCMLLVIGLCSLGFGQSHTFCASDSNCTLTGNNSYLGTTAETAVTGAISYTISAATESSTTVTITTTATCTVIANQAITISGVGVAGYNGLFAALTACSGNSFTYQNPQSGLGASSGGTVLLSPVYSGGITLTGPTSITSASLNDTNAGVWTNTAQHDYIVANIGTGLNLATEYFNQYGSYATEGLVSGGVVPNTSTVSQFNAVAGYAINNSTTTNAVGGFFQSRTNTNNGKSWGGNAIAICSAGTSGCQEWGFESNVNILNPAHSTSVGVDSVSGGLYSPYEAFRGTNQRGNAEWQRILSVGPVADGSTIEATWSGGSFIDTGRTVTQVITGSGSPQNVTTNIPCTAAAFGFGQGGWLSVDSGGSQEDVKITAIAACNSNNATVTGIFTKSHSNGAVVYEYSGFRFLDLTNAVFRGYTMRLGSIQNYNTSNTPAFIGFGVADSTGVDRLTDYYDAFNAHVFRSLGAGHRFEDSTGAGKLWIFSDTVGGSIRSAEGNGPPMSAGTDALWADSTAHRWKMNNNNGSSVQVVGSGADINTSDQVTVMHSIYEAGSNANTTKIYTNTQALTAGAATHTLANSFSYTSSATFGCTCTDQTAAAACKAVPASATTVTLAGTGTDTLWLSCSGH